VDGEYRIEQVRQPYAVGFGDEAEKGTIAVKAPRLALLHDLYPWLIVPVQQLIRNFSCRCLICEFQCRRSKPLYVDDVNEAVREDTFY
jgi:hypothetical protein